MTAARASSGGGPPGASSAPAAGRLSIAMIGHKGVPALHGGIERHVDEISRRLAGRGHRVDVFNRLYHPEHAATWEGVHLLRRPSVPTKHLDAGTHTLWCVLESVLSRRYDVVHIHGIGPGIFVGLARPFVPTVFTFHAQDYRQRKWGHVARWSLRRGEAVAVRGAREVITVSRLLQRYVAETYGRSAIYIPNGANPGPRPDSDRLARWNLSREEYVLFVGRLLSDRGLGTLLDAWQGITAPWQLVIVGDLQHDRDRVELLRRRAGARVVFTGYQSGSALEQLYAHAALCVHPSEVEGLPIAVLEAMSHARAVLVSDIPENLEAIGDSGASFPVRDVAALHAALVEWLARPQARRELGERAVERVRREFDWDRITTATEAVYRRALGVQTHAATSLESHANPLQGNGSN